MCTTAVAVAAAAAVLLLVAPTAAQEVKLCDKCSCSAKLLNCTRRGLERLPRSDDAWPLDVEEALFDHNGIAHVEILPAMPNLRRLSFSHNEIQVIDEKAFCNLTALQELDLSSNQLTRSVLKPDVFKGHYDRNEYQPLKNLTVLRLSSNSIHSLDSDIFEHVAHLRVLSLAFNPMRVIDTPTLNAISSLAYLEHLDLTHVGIESLPPHVLHTLNNLTTLNVSSNQFTEVPSELANSHQLRELMESLRVLQMDYMHNLTRVGAAGFAPLKGLKVLRLSHSPTLTEIHPNAFVGTAESEGNATYPHLEELILRGNSLRTLDFSLLRRWDELQMLDLENNNWLCDCDLQWMVSELEPIINRTNPSLLRNFRCTQPEPMAGQSIFELHLRHYHLRCLDADGAHPERDGLILVGVLVGVLMAVPATLALVLCWRRGGFPWPLSNGPASYSRAFYRRADNIDDF
ncbi:Protein artichoke [Gryllus bimaculatus]|nr:Protein artichoke [Gryllus bimaculatus]